MSRWPKLLAKARSSTANLSFAEVCWLAETAGFERKRQKGSHVYFHNPRIPDAFLQGLSLQEGRDGKAKPYQVRQLLDRIDDFDLGPRGEEER